MQSWKKKRIRKILKGEELSAMVLRDREPAHAGQDGGINDQWTDLAETRFLDLESGKVRGTTWQEIKKRVVSPKI